MHLRHSACPIWGLILFLLLIQVVCVRAQNAGPSGTKVRTSAPSKGSLDISLSATPDYIREVLVDTPTYKEIDAEASLVFQVSGGDEDPTIQPFWVGKSAFLASAQTPPPSPHDVFNPQLYSWNVQAEPIVPLAPPEGLTPTRIFKVGTYEIAGGIPGYREIRQTWNDLPPWVQDVTKFTLQGITGLEERAVDGRPLAVLKPNISRPDKYFYWDLGNLQNTSFPQSTTTRVHFSSPGEGVAGYTAEARINWHMPSRKVWEVELELWDWVDASEAPTANFDDWVQKLFKDDELINEIRLDTALFAAEILVDRFKVGRVVIRFISSSKIPATQVTQRILEKVMKITRRPVEVPVGSPIPDPPIWHSRSEVRVKARDAHPHLVPESRIEQVAKTNPDIRNAPVDKDGNADPDEKNLGKREDRRDQPIGGRVLYLYSATDNFNAARWQNPHGVSGWQLGYYLTDIPPDDIVSPPSTGKTASDLRSGQLSFAMFGHPYAWEKVPTVYWAEITTGETRVNGVKVRDAWASAAASYDLKTGPNNSDEEITYRTWGSRVSVYAGDQTNNGYEIHSSRILRQGGVTFKSGAPGVLDVPASFAMMPQTGRKGQWLNPKTNAPWPTSGPDSVGNINSPTNLNPDTKRPYRADSLWEPAVGSPLYELTQGGTIKYSRGYPIFDNYVEFAATLDPMKGNIGSDFTDSDSQFENSPNFQRVKQQYPTVDSWMRNSTHFTSPRTIVVPSVAGTEPNWVWHHHQDMKQMQLVPSVLNSPKYEGVHHRGGAEWAKNARW